MTDRNCNTNSYILYYLEATDQKVLYLYHNCHEFIYEIAGKMDSRNIVHGLMTNFWKEENEHLHNKVGVLNSQIDKLAGNVCEQNAFIARLQSEILYYQRLTSSYRRNERVLIDRNGRHVMYRRNDEGIFVAATDTLEGEDIQTDNEDPEEIARRLGFESDSDYESDDLMTMLMGE